MTDDQRVESVVEALLKAVARLEELGDTGASIDLGGVLYFLRAQQAEIERLTREGTMLANTVEQTAMRNMTLRDQLDAATTRAEQAEEDRDRWAGLLLLAQEKHIALRAENEAMRAAMVDACEIADGEWYCITPHEAAKRTAWNLRPFTQPT